MEDLRRSKIRKVPIQDPITLQVYAMEEKEVLLAMDRAMGSMETAAKFLQVPVSWLYEFRRQHKSMDRISAFWDEHRAEMLKQKIFEMAMRGNQKAIHYLMKIRGSNARPRTAGPQYTGEPMAEAPRTAAGTPDAGFAAALNRIRLSTMGREGREGDDAGDDWGEEDPAVSGAG